jgi:hypothetical protein
VAVIGAFVDAPRIVKNGEQLDDFDLGPRKLGQPQAIFENPGPMADAVGASPRKGIILKDSMDEWFQVTHKPFMPVPGPTIVPSVSSPQTWCFPRAKHTAVKKAIPLSSGSSKPFPFATVPR